MSEYEGDPKKRDNNEKLGDMEKTRSSRDKTGSPGLISEAENQDRCRTITRSWETRSMPYHVVLAGIREKTKK